MDTRSTVHLPMLYVRLFYSFAAVLPYNRQVISDSSFQTASKNATTEIVKSEISVLKSPMTARTRTDFLLLAGFCAFLFFYGLGAFGLLGADEPRYAQVAREMLDRHDWITPVLNGRPWLEKPPLYYWQAMLAYSAFGVSDSAARMPSAFDATLLVIVVYLFFRKFRRGVETDAALITASCAGIIGYARAASMDMPLTAAFAIGMLAWWAWRESGAKIYLAAFYMCAALGMLAKGPVAPFLAAAVIVDLCSRDARVAFDRSNALVPGSAPVLFGCASVVSRSADAKSGVLSRVHPATQSRPVFQQSVSPSRAILVLPSSRGCSRWCPGSFLSQHRLWNRCVRGGLNAQRNRPSWIMESQFGIFACCWLVVPVVFFSISQSKLPGYILPAIPAGAVLLADYLRRRIEEEEAVSKWMALGHALVASAPFVPAAADRFCGDANIVCPQAARCFSLWRSRLCLCVAIAVTLVSKLRFRMLRFVTLIPVVLSVAAVLKLGTTSIDQKLSARPLAVELASVETHKLASRGVWSQARTGIWTRVLSRSSRYVVMNREQFRRKSICWWRRRLGWTTSRSKRLDVAFRFSDTTLRRTWTTTGSRP